MPYLRVSWQEVVDLFHQALSVPEPDRTAFIQSRCGPATPLFFEVQALLASAEPLCLFYNEAPGIH